MAKPSPLLLLLTPALVAFASLAHGQPAAAPSSVASSSTSGMSGAASRASARTAPSNAAGPVTDAASFGRDSSFANDNGNPELGLAPGQTSSGTLAGNEPNGLDVGSPTPLLDQATRNAEQRLARERATGRAPRVIGIAPRTDADRTDEMPDDPIIRY